MSSSSVWKDVPDDVLVWVLSFLPPWELLSTVSLVSKEWHRTLQQVPFWKSLIPSSSLDQNWTLHQWQQCVLLQDSQPQSILVPRRHAQHLRRSTGTRACLASSTHHRNELLEHVLLETQDEEWILDYDDVEVPSPRSAPYWSSGPSPTANSTETLCFTTRHAQCLVTHVAIEPFSVILREQDEDYSVLGWKQWQVQAYLMRDDEHDVSSTRWGSPSTMTRPSDAEEDPILNAVRLLEELVGPQEFTSLAPSDQDYIPPLLEHSKLVYESDLLTTDEDDWFHHDLPSGIVANLIVLKLLDKTTEIPGIGYCACVQRVVVQGQPFYPSPHVQLWCQQLSEHEYEDPREVQATELFQFLVQIGMPPDAPPGFFPWLPPFPHDDDEEEEEEEDDDDEWEDDDDEEEEDDDDDSLESLPELIGRDDDDDSLEDLPPLIGDDGRVLSVSDRQDEDNDESGCGDSLPELLPGDVSSDNDSLLQCPHCHVVLDDDSSYDSMPDLWIPNPDDSSSDEEDDSDNNSLPALLPGNVDDSFDSDSPPPPSQPKAEDSSDDSASDSMPPLIHPDAEDSSDEDSDSTPPPLLPRTVIDDSSDSDSVPPLLPRTTASSEETDDSSDNSMPPLLPTDAGSSPDRVPSRVGNSQGKTHVGPLYLSRGHNEEEKKQKEE